MFRLATSDPALLEAHVQAERARHELDGAIREAFVRYEELDRRLKAFDTRLAKSRSHLREAGYLGNDGLHPDFGARSQGPTGRRGAAGRQRSHRASRRATATAA